MKFLVQILIIYLGSVQPSFAKVSSEALGYVHPTRKEMSWASCKFANPLRDLAWLKSLHEKDPSKTICEYRKGGLTYFKVYNCNNKSSLAYWYNCEGLYKGKTNQNDNALGNYIGKGSQFVKCWFTSCKKLNLPAPLCFLMADYVSPQKNQRFRKGTKVIVQIDSQQYGNIAYIDLYLNNILVRRETTYPFKWGVHRHLDSALRVMQPGNYVLKAIIKDKCGQSKIKNRTFYVF